jgi:hypothetical protein
MITLKALLSGKDVMFLLKVLMSFIHTYLVGSCHNIFCLLTQGSHDDDV